MVENSSNTGSDGERFLERLPSELARWESAGIITAEQSQVIRSRYSATDQAPRAIQAQGRLVTALAVIGSVLVGLGIIMFFAANWDGIDRWPKLAIIFGSILTAHGLGYYLRYHRGYVRVGTGMILLACVIYGAGVHLVGQVYHVDVNDPRLMLFWFLGVAPLVYIVKSQPIQFLGLVLLLLTLGFRLPDWIENVNSGEALLGASMFLILGLLILSVGRIKEEIKFLRPYSEVFQLVGLITALGSIFFLTFKDVFDSLEYGRFTRGDIELGYQILIVVAGVLVLGLVTATAWLHRRNENSFTLVRIEGVAIVIALAAAYVVISVGSETGVLYTAVLNGLLAFALLGVLVSGYLRGREAWVNIGLAYIGIDITARYFEYSWDLFDRSLIFVAAGVILLVGGYLVERARQKMVELIRSAALISERPGQARQEGQDEPSVEDCLLGYGGRADYIIAGFHRLQRGHPPQRYQRPIGDCAG
ncbi:MAG: DUF2157 domain-containing protein [Dehalococcoidia bacterium]|nr:DUF2157 domain-containing protein [Dehalococcoidia bacterium]